MTLHDNSSPILVVHDRPCQDRTLLLSQKMLQLIVLCVLCRYVDSHSCSFILHLGCAAGGAQPVPEQPTDTFSQQPRYVEMCVRVMETAEQQGLGSQLTAWSQTVLQNVQSLCKMPQVEPERLGMILCHFQ